METLLFGVVVTIAVMVAIAVLILVFERRRAREIQQDPERLPPTDRDGRPD
jgi:hypothetical protein